MCSVQTGRAALARAAGLIDTARQTVKHAVVPSRRLAPTLGVLLGLVAGGVSCSPRPFEPHEPKAQAPERVRSGMARAQVAQPARFPHRIWAACDFEASLPDYAWFGRPRRDDVPAYPGNATALASEPWREGGWVNGMNPVLRISAHDHRREAEDRNQQR